MNSNFTVFSPFFSSITIRFVVLAMQAILFGVAVFVLFIILGIFSAIFAFIPVIGPLIVGLIYFVLWIGVLILWVMLMIKAYKGEMYKLPIIGDMAEKAAK